MPADDQLLSSPAHCLEWAAPLGGLAVLSPQAEDGRTGRLRRLLRDIGGGSQSAQADPQALAEAERLAGSIARMVCPGVRVRWAASAAPSRKHGEVLLDSRLLLAGRDAARRGWDLPHRVDALMGMTLYDAAHAARTPAAFRHELWEHARRAGLLPAAEEGAESPSPEQHANEAFAPLLALFLLVEMAHIRAWLDAEFPGFRGYGAALWAWRIPAGDAEARLRAVRGRPTFGAVLNAAATLVAGRGSLDDAGGMRPLLETLLAAVQGIGATASPSQRYGLALALYRMLKDLFESGDEEARQIPRGEGQGDDQPDQVEVEPPAERPDVADEDLEGRQAALEALAAIAANGLDPEEARQGLSPEELREAQRLGAGMGQKRGAGASAQGAEEGETLVSQRHLRVAGSRPMRLITPPLSPDVRVRYAASYGVVRGQAAALRQVLKFRLAERRHATHGQYSGLLDEQALYRLAGGDEGVFMRRTIESAPNQDLCILLDESASMGAGQRHARATAILFHHALRGLPGVRHWIFGFSGYGHAIALYRYLSPSHASLQQPERLGAVRSREATPLAEAVAGAAEAMLAEAPQGGARGERLMIVVTDGQPDDVEGARRALRAAESRGIAILGLGIAADATAARDLFSHFTLYEDVATLPRKVGAILRRVVGTTL